MLYIGCFFIFLLLILNANQVKAGKTNISSLDYFTYALGNYKSVEELIEDLPNINISTKDYRGENVISPDFHFILLYHIASLVIGVIFLKFADSKYVEYEEKTTKK